MAKKTSLKIDPKDLISVKRVKAILKKELEEAIADKVKWAMDDLVNEEVKTFVKKEITPEIKKMLVKEKANIILGLKKAIEQVVAKVGEAFLATAVKNMESGYKVGEIAKAIFD